jgi:uncharacterized protein (DUF433 family)
MAVIASSSVGPARPLTPESLVGDRIQPGHPLFGIVWMNPERVSGAPCFAGTRVPVRNLFDYLESNYTLEQFLDDFDGVTRQQAIAVLELAQSDFLEGLRGA